MKRTSAISLCAALLMLAACSSSHGGSSTLAIVPTAAAKSTTSLETSIDGEWHQRFTCDEQVRTFQRNLAKSNRSTDEELAKLKGNTDASLPTLLKEYIREFAWGPNAKTAIPLTPDALCKGAPDRERIMRVGAGELVLFDWDKTSWGAANVTMVDDHTFTVNDGFENFGSSKEHPTDVFSFRINGTSLVISNAGLVDAWAGSFLEEAPWQRAT